MTPAQAKYVLDRLVEERKISAIDITRALREMHTEIAKLEDRLGFLRGLKTQVKQTSIRTDRSPAATQSRRGKGTSPAAAASRKLQGRYLGLIKRIPEGKRNSFRKIANTKGRAAAIAAMELALRE
jgi:hypothetical protein